MGFSVEKSWWFQNKSLTLQHKTYLIKVRAMKYPIGIQTFDKIRNEGYVLYR